MPTHHHSRHTSNARFAYRPLLTRNQMQARVQMRARAPLARLNITNPPPAWSSLVSQCGKPYDQTTIGSCTANAEIRDHDILTKFLKPWLSRLFLYASERERETTGVLQDSGADPIDGLEFFRQVGVVEESLWPYDVTKVNVRPPSNLNAAAAQYKITDYRRLNAPDLTGLKTMIARGFPVVLGISVYQSFMSESVAKTGTVPLPNPQSLWNGNDPVDPYVGGHEILAVAYDDTKQVVTCLNSWGDQWGDHGFFTLPYAYMTNPQLVLSQAAITAV
jgi:C1A family cysteine protease